MEENKEEKPLSVELLEDGTCPTGYYFDKETQSCILDVGGPGGEENQSEVNE